MVPDLRQSFNNSFSAQKYRAFLADLDSQNPGHIEFRVAETPVFVDKAFKEKILGTCESIIDLVTGTGFLEMTRRSIPPGYEVPHQNDHCHMLAFDFGVCISEENELEPQLIEMQGFPSLYSFQIYYPEILRKHFNIPENYSHYLNGYDKESYLADLRDVILGGEQPEHVILLEIKPFEQKTRIDFFSTEYYLGIQPVCISDLIPGGNDLYYIHEKSRKKTRVKRIYNRVIFDDLDAQRATLGKFPDITKEWNVTWVPHPNWFYRISKFTLPFIHHPYVPKTYFLNEVTRVPDNLENYVLKPLFSFAGQGVVIDVTREDIEKVSEPENWILQHKVKYAEVIQTPDDPAKVEIRMMYLWKDGWDRPRPAINLARLSKGKMIGVRYNKDKEWVGGSVCFFEKD